jgi:maltose-binding protein MalE
MYNREEVLEKIKLVERAIRKMQRTSLKPLKIKLQQDWTVEENITFETYLDLKNELQDLKNEYFTEEIKTNKQLQKVARSLSMIDFIQKDYHKPVMVKFKGKFIGLPEDTEQRLII